MVWTISVGQLEDLIQKGIWALTCNLFISGFRALTHAFCTAVEETKKARPTNQSAVAAWAERIVETGAYSFGLMYVTCTEQLYHYPNASRSGPPQQIPDAMLVSLVDGHHRAGGILKAMYVFNIYI